MQFYWRERDRPSYLPIAATAMLPLYNDASCRRLLIIEDDHSTCIAIGKIAEKVGFATTSACSLEEASKLLRSERFDCITLDLLLGENSSIALFRTLAETAPMTPIIIISGSADWMRGAAESLGKAARLNLAVSMIKPINFANLREVLTTVHECKPLPASVLQQA